MIALGVAVVAAYVKFEGFRKVVHAVINFVIRLVEDFVNFWIKGINMIIMANNALIRVINFFLVQIFQHLDTLVSVIWSYR
jgi:phage-related protein